MSGSKFVYVTYIRAQREKIFDALRLPQFTQLWWNETIQDSAWKKGATWNIRRPDGIVADMGEVLEFDPPRRFVVSWRNEFIPGMREEGFSRCAVDLEIVEDAVKVTITHEIDVPNSKLIDGVSRGWPALMASLKSYLETGKPLELTRRWPKDR